MDSKKLSALLVAVEKGSLTAAAEELGYTQAGLTHMMNALESEIGLPLLIRSKSGVRLSPQGLALHEEIRTLVADARALEEKCGRLKQEQRSAIRIGTYSSISRQWLPSILSDFRQVCPETDVAVSMDSMTGIYYGVRAGAMDCAFVSYQPSLISGLSWIPLYDDELLAILPAGDETKGRYPVTGFQNREFLMPSLGFDLDITPVFSAPGGKVSPRVRYTNMDDAAIVSMVAHGLGVSILTELVMKSIQEKVKTLPLDPPAFRKIGLILPPSKQNDRNVRRFLHCTKETLRRLYPEQETTV